MCGEHDDRAFRNLIDCFDRECALGFNIGDDMLVVYDFMLHVNGFSVTLERNLHYVYCPYDSCAKASWRGQKYLQITPSLANYFAPVLDRLLGVS